MRLEHGKSVFLGDYKKAIFYIAVPLVISLFVAEINILADRAWCSGLGVGELAAVSVVTPLYNTFVGLGSGLGVGASAVISRMMGANKNRDAAICGVQAIVLAVAFGLVLTPILFFSQSGILNLIGTEDVMDLSMQYMTYFTIFISFIIVNGTIGGVLNGQGAPVYSTIMMAVLAISNIILDPIFIYGLNMGVAGASAATIVSTVLAMFVGIGFLLSKKVDLRLDRSMLRCDASHMRSIAVAGVPQMVDYSILYAMDAVLNLIVLNCAGSTGLTIISTPDKLIEALFIPAMAIGSAVVTVASFAYGQNDAERMSKTFRYGLKVAISIVIVEILIVELLADWAMIPFTYSSEMSVLRPDMVNALRVLCLYAPLFAFTPVCSGYLQALRYPNFSVYCALWRNMVLIAVYLIASTISLYAICWSLVVGHTIGMVTIMLVVRYASKNVYAKIRSGASPAQI